MLKKAAFLMIGHMVSASAVAADRPPENASASLIRGVSVYNWSGIYAGVSAGGLVLDMPSHLADPVFGASHARGVLAGLQLGFNKQVGSFVIGLEADASLARARGEKSRAVSGAYGDYAVTGSGKLEARLSQVSTVRVRVGYARDAMLVFASAGPAFGRHRLEMSGPITGTLTTQTVTADQAGASSYAMAGWAEGAGFEYAWARGVSIKGEYLHLQFNESTFFGNSWAASKTRSTVNLFRSGVNVRI